MRSFDFANQAPRCKHTRLNGQPCHAPARRGRLYCHFHEAAARKDYALPLLEDPTSVQLAIMQVLRALKDNEIDLRRAAIMLYGLQIATSNMKRFQADLQPSDEEQAARQQSLAQFLIDKLDLEPEPGLDDSPDPSPPSLAPKLEAGCSS
jgi:hypothetical protein